MSDLICRKTMMRCQTPGMCSPHGGCSTSILKEASACHSPTIQPAEAERNMNTRKGYDYWDKLCAIPRHGFIHSPDNSRVLKVEGIGNWIDQHRAQEVVDEAQSEVNQLRAEVEALRAELAKHPTPEAYDVACSALWKHRAANEALRAILPEARRVAYQAAIDRSDPDYARELIGRIDAAMAAKESSQ